MGAVFLFFFVAMPSCRTRGNGHKLEIRTNFTLRMTEHWVRLSREVVYLLYRYSKSTCALATYCREPALAVRLYWMTSISHFQPL